jgi:hypothetical protein
MLCTCPKKEYMDCLLGTNYYMVSNIFFACGYVILSLIFEGLCVNHDESIESPIKVLIQKNQYSVVFFCVFPQLL